MHCLMRAAQIRTVIKSILKNAMCLLEGNKKCKYTSLDLKSRIYHPPTDATFVTMEWILVERSKMFADGAEII